MLLYWPVAQFSIIFIFIAISFTKIQQCFSQYNDYNANVYKEYLKNVHSNSVDKIISCPNCSHQKIFKRDTIDTTFHGHPKTREERWHFAFKTDTSENNINEAISLVELLIKVTNDYLNECIPIILYDVHVEFSNGIILETFFKVRYVM